MDLRPIVFVLFFFGAIFPHSRSARINKLDWHNPCQYRNRTVRQARSLTIQVHMALQEYKTINATIVDLYGTNKKYFATKNDLSTTKGLLKFYRDFNALGKKTQRALTQRLKTEDNKFNHTARKNTLTKIRDMTVSIMCEMYDVLRQKNKSIDSIEKTINTTKTNIREPSNIQKQAGLSEAMAIDSTLSVTYHKLLIALRKTLRRHNKRRPVPGERKKRRRKKCTKDKKC